MAGLLRAGLHPSPATDHSSQLASSQLPVTRDQSSENESAALGGQGNNAVGLVTVLRHRIREREEAQQKQGANAIAAFRILAKHGQFLMDRI